MSDIFDQLRDDEYEAMWGHDPWLANVAGYTIGGLLAVALVFQGGRALWPALLFVAGAVRSAFSSHFGG